MVDMKIIEKIYKEEEGVLANQMSMMIIMINQKIEQVLFFQKNNGSKTKSSKKVYIRLQ